MDDLVGGAAQANTDDDSQQAGAAFGGHGNKTFVEPSKNGDSMFA